MLGLCGKGGKCMKRFLLLLLPLILLTGCTPHASKESGDRLTIVATLFPQYDFAREICKDTADVHLLLPPGTDSHSYDPTPKDMLLLQSADLILYTGAAMEPWAEKLIKNVKGKAQNVSEGILLLSGSDIHESHVHEESEAATDPHIWTNPQNAILMAENICEAVSALCPERASFYAENFSAYKNKLENLDAEFEKLTASASRKHIIFGGHFAMRYFTNRYGLTYTAAFDSCSGEAEPSPAHLLNIIETMKKENIKAVYYEELSTPKTAFLIAEETGARALLLHSCHTLSKDEAGETYLTLMQKNLENLKIGLE